MAAAGEGVGAPVRTDAEVVENRAEGGANRRLVLRVPAWPGFAPGQFAMLSPGPRLAAPLSDPLLPRPMAIYRARPAGGAADVEILFRVAGRGTALLGEARRGQRVGWLGPLGRGFALPEPGGAAVLVAGGTGVASIFELAVRLAPRGPVVVLLGARRGDDLMGRTDFESLGIDLRVATEDGSEGSRGLVTDLLGAELASGPPGLVYACGPTAMMRRAAELGAQHGRTCVVSLEHQMACGFGVCLGCAAPLRAGGFSLVCRDGPMFDAEAIAWDGLP